MTTPELDRNLSRFYVEARTKECKEYSRSALLGFRNAIERFINNNGKSIKLSKNNQFQQSNKILDAKLKINRRAGKENVKHKAIIVQRDMQKIKTSAYLAMDNPNGLLRRTWFFVTLYWCRRGREGQRTLRSDSFKFCQDENGREYAVMTHDEATKNHPGGENSKPSDEKETRMYSTETPDDAFASLKLYVSKLNPKCKAFFQHPRANFAFDDAVWYENKPIGVNKLGDMMKSISIGAELSQVYTNHSVRASAITLLSNANVPDRHIMFVSGHSNEQSIAHYSSRPTVSQLENVSDTFSNALQNQPSINKDRSITSAGNSASFISSKSNTSTVNVAASNMSSFPTGFFSSCNIGTVQVMFNQQGHPEQNI